jgi:hypothetical protein
MPTVPWPRVWASSPTAFAATCWRLRWPSALSGCWAGWRCKHKKPAHKPWEAATRQHPQRAEHRSNVQGLSQQASDQDVRVRAQDLRVYRLSCGHQRATSQQNRCENCPDAGSGYDRERQQGPRQVKWLARIGNSELYTRKLAKCPLKASRCMPGAFPEAATTYCSPCGDHPLLERSNNRLGARLAFPTRARNNLAAIRSFETEVAWTHLVH